MAESDHVHAAIEIEGRVIQQHEVFEAANLRATRAQWAAFHATRSREEVEDSHQRGTQAFKEERRQEQSARRAFVVAERAQRNAFGELKRLEALLRSLRAGHVPGD